MIAPSPRSNALPATSWVAGIALAFLGIGGHGAISGLVARPEIVVIKAAAEPEEIMIEEFNPPPAAASTEEEVPSDPPTEEPEEIEIPEVAEITPPLDVPEMAEITPLVQYVEPPKPIEVAKAPEPKPEPPKPRPVAARPAPSRQPSAGTAPTGMASAVSGTGTSTAKLIRSPKPFYPSAEQRAGHQGKVRLLVTVEANGSASSVTVASSSGFPALDESARDTVQRRWRWSAGQPLRTYVPISFALK
jgi:periplasmic protein TonB